ncbi:MAG: DUF6152 family protein [Bryobacteraceae bacterium]
MISFAVLLVTLPASAHHSLAMYDMIRPLTLKGVVERVEWANPHVHLYLSVKDGKGQPEEWTIEMDRPDFLTHNGWTSATIQPGDVITCTGGAAKNGARAMRCTTVELASGQRLRS